MTTIFTVGHGTRTTEELARALRSAGVQKLVDVRRFPGSRRNPHFAREALERSLPDLGIAYEWWGEELGGRRDSKRSGSRHAVWRNAAFQGYADYMDTEEFRGALRRLEQDAEEDPIAIMCAETLWWKCHRRLISDALHLHGVEVIHIIDENETEKHKPNPEMRAGEDGYPVYDVGMTNSMF